MPIFYYTLAAYLFTISIGLYNLRALSRPYKLVFTLLLLATATEVYGHYIYHTLHKYNAWLFNFYVIIEAWLLGLAAVYLVNDKKTRKVFFLLLIINTTVWITIIVKNSLFIFANLSMVFGAILLVIMYIVILFKNVLFSSTQIHKQPEFWLSLSTIVYFGCDVPVMALFGYLTEKLPRSLAHNLTHINSALNFIRYPLVAISFIILGREKRKQLKTA